MELLLFGNDKMPTFAEKNKHIKHNIMKKFTTLLATMAVAIMGLTFTSCEDDNDIANTLWGVWEGDMYVTYTYGGQSYDASYSEIAFKRDPSRYAEGTGYWIDYYSNAPWDYCANHIRWHVDNGVISVYFVEDGGAVDIYDYQLSPNYFTGVIYNSYGEALHFSLRKTSAPYWDDLEYGWDYWDNYYDDYAKPNMAPAEGAVREKPVRSFRKL